jgi:hypothetical protein
MAGAGSVGAAGALGGGLADGLDTTGMGRPGLLEAGAAGSRVAKAIPPTTRTPRREGRRKNTPERRGGKTIDERRNKNLGRYIKRKAGGETGERQLRCWWVKDLETEKS